MSRLFQHEPLLIHLCLAALTLVLAFGMVSGHAGGFLAAQQMSRQIPPGWWASITILGDERVLLAICLPFCVRNPRLLWSITVAAVIAAIACRALKWGLAWPRPLSVLPAGQVVVIGHPVKSYAMPSGHTASVFALVGVLLGWIGQRTLLVCLGLAVLAGFSRVAVGAHWPLDVMAGAVIGLVAARCSQAVVRRWDWGERQRPFVALMSMAGVGIASLLVDAQGYPETQVLRALLCLWAVLGTLFAMSHRNLMGLSRPGHSRFLS